MKCKNCIKWVDVYKHSNGIFGKCTKNKYWCNENYQCVTSKIRKEEGKNG